MIEYALFFFSNFSELEKTALQFIENYDDIFMPAKNS
jgi:hypothetical protein